MQAAVVNEFGKPPRYQEFPEPVLQEGEVLVRVGAAGLHPLVKALAGGTHYSSGGELPAVAGVDGIGVLADGKRVYFALVRKPWGTMAELASARRSACVPVPDGISDIDAAAMGNPGMSGWVSLRHRAKLVAGETVLIMGATGVAGQLAIQAARLLGARRIIGVGRNLEAIAAADVDSRICLNDPEDAIREAFSAEAAAGIDVVVDYLWGRPTELLLEALAKQFNRTLTHRTRLVEVGDRAGKTITLAGGTLRSIDLHVMGSGIGAASMEQILASISELYGMAAEGKLKISAVPVPLKEVETAWNQVEQGSRIVFTI